MKERVVNDASRIKAYELSASIADRLQDRIDEQSGVLQVGTSTSNQQERIDRLNSGLIRERHIQEKIAFQLSEPEVIRMAREFNDRVTAYQRELLKMLARPDTDPALKRGLSVIGKSFDIAQITKENEEDTYSYLCKNHPEVLPPDEASYDIKVNPDNGSVWRGDFHKQFKTNSINWAVFFTYAVLARRGISRDEIVQVGKGAGSILSYPSPLNNGVEVGLIGLKTGPNNHAGWGEMPRFICHDYRRDLFYLNSNVTFVDRKGNPIPVSDVANQYSADGKLRP